MSFFKPFPQQPIPEVTPEEPLQKEQYIDPRMVIIEGTNLIKVVDDNPEIKEGKVEKYLNGPMSDMVPYNYDLKTGDIK
jgi:hypothetical protein